MKKLRLAQKILTIIVTILIGIFFLTKPNITTADGIEVDTQVFLSKGYYSNTGQYFVDWTKIPGATSYCLKLETVTKDYVYPPEIICGITTNKYDIPMEHPSYYYDSETVVRVAVQKENFEDLQFSENYLILSSKMEATLTTPFLTLKEGYTREDAENLQIIVASHNAGDMVISAQDFLLQLPNNEEGRPVAKLKYGEEEDYLIQIRDIFYPQGRLVMQIIPEVGLKPGEYPIEVIVMRRKRTVLNKTITIRVESDTVSENPEQPQHEGQEEDPGTTEEEPQNPGQEPEDPQEDPENPQPEPETPQKPEKPEKEEDYIDPLAPKAPKTPQAGAK